MDETTLKRLAVDAATERAVGSTNIPMKYFASLVKEAKAMLIGHKEETDALQRQIEQRDSQIQQFSRILDAFQREIARIQEIKGEKGDKGDPGLPGKDGKNAKEVDIEKFFKRIMDNIRQPEDGKDATVDIDALAEMTVQKIFADKKLKKEHIDGLVEEIASYRSQLAGKHYGKDTWARGGGDTISAGSNITLVHKADGTVEINAAGGGSGTNVTTQYQVTAVQSGSNVTIDLTQLTNWATFTDLILVIRNNFPQTEGIDFTVAGSVVTVNGADASEIFNIQYAYA